MDLLFHRYASPFSLLDHMIDNESLSDFIDCAFEAYGERLEWEFYLAKEVDKSFYEFSQSLKSSAVHHTISKANLETTVIHSWNILNNFIPD